MSAARRTGPASAHVLLSGVLFILASSCQKPVPDWYTARVNWYRQTSGDLLVTANRVNGESSSPLYQYECQWDDAQRRMRTRIDVAGQPAVTVEIVGDKATVSKEGTVLLKTNLTVKIRQFDLNSVLAFHSDLIAPGGFSEIGRPASRNGRDTPVYTWSLGTPGDIRTLTVELGPDHVMPRRAKVVQDGTDDTTVVTYRVKAFKGFQGVPSASRSGAALTDLDVDPKIGKIRRSIAMAAWPDPGAMDVFTGTADQWKLASRGTQKLTSVESLATLFPSLVWRFPPAFGRPSEILAHNATGADGQRIQVVRITWMDASPPVRLEVQVYRVPFQTRPPMGAASWRANVHSVTVYGNEIEDVAHTSIANWASKDGRRLFELIAPGQHQGEIVKYVQAIESAR